MSFLDSAASLSRGPGRITGPALDELLQTIQRLNGAGSPETVCKGDKVTLPRGDGGTVTLPLRRRCRDRKEIIPEYWNFHPRFRFIKTAPQNGALVDIGAGSGGLPGWKTWSVPVRSDLKMYAVDIKYNEAFRNYDGFDIVDMGNENTKFADGFFDCANLSHLVEHVADRSRLFREVSRITRAGSSVYVEWPTSQSTQFVPRTILSQVGIEAGTINFFDDATHLAPVPMESVEGELEAGGFRCVERGLIQNDYLRDELFAHAFMHKDSTIMTYALWLAFGFSQYVIARRR